MKGKMFKNYFIGFVFLLSCNLAYPQSPKYSNEFLAIGIGARALGMSNSVVSVVDDVTSGYWNPAGLTHINSNLQLGLMHSEYFAGIAKFDYGAIAAKLDTQSVGAFSFIRFGVDDIPNTTDLIDAEGNIDYDRITTFSAADYAFIFSYGRKLSSGLRVGVNVKIIHRKVGDFANSWGFGLDAGAQYSKNGWQLGAICRDITTTFNAWSFDLTDQMKEVFTITGNEIPSNSLELTLPKLILSGGRNFKLSPAFSIMPVIDVDVTFDGKRNVLIKGDPISIDPHLGLEFSYKDIVFLRGGAGNVQQETDMLGKKITTFQPNMGLGIRIKKTVEIDYAFTDIGDQSIALYSHIFSLRFNINRKEQGSN
jgi:hypothetical protein